MNDKKVSFSTLKVGDYFKYKGRVYRKTLVVDMGSCVYNVISDPIRPTYGSEYQYFDLLLDSVKVKPIQK